MKTLSRSICQVHELELLQSIYASPSTHKHVTIAPGDDMGEVHIGKERVLCAVDQLIVGRHVTSEIDPGLIGRKAIARSFSDIAAMCATPVGCLMTACVPPETPNTWCKAVFSGAKEAADQWGGPIFGGDIASADGPPIFTVTALATPPISGGILRTGAQENDYVCVTGELGNSIAGHHLTFTPRIAEAQKLLQILGKSLHSMIDISDGLGIDASHLANETLQVVINTELLPLRKGATIRSAISDGEDYELLFTSESKPPSDLATVIGKVQIGEPKVITTTDEDISSFGWNHG